MVGESGARLVSVAEVALVFADPVSDGALGEASVGLLATGGEVGHLGSVDNTLGHAVPWYGASFSSTVAIAPSTFLHLAAVHHLVVVLFDLLRHVWHGGVGYLYCVPIHHPPQLMVWREAGVDELKELRSER